MSDKELEKIADVDIDAEGVFKYILIKVYAKEQEDGTEPNKLVVRGYQRCEYHADIYDEFTETIQKKKIEGIDSECLGGGRILHYPHLKKLKIYGYSTGFGRADHIESQRVLAKVYPDYHIETSDEGY